MVRSTMISRVSDGLALAASIDDEQDEAALSEYKQQAKLVLRRLTPQSEPQCSIESGACSIHYVNDIVYLTIADKSYPRKLAFSYLDEVQKEFERSFGEEARKPGLRPYAFVKFDSFMQRTKRLYQDTRAAAAKNANGLDKLNDELREVTNIMVKVLNGPSISFDATRTWTTYFGEATLWIGCRLCPRHYATNRSSIAKPPGRSTSMR